MKPRLIDLNKWTKTDREESIEGYSGLIIRPQRFIDGTQPPDIFFRKGEPLVPHIDNIVSAVWYKDCQISKEGTELEYIKLVDWWFENAEIDDEYRNIINDTFNHHGFDVKMSWDKAKNWLKRQHKDARKTYVHKFVWNWMTKGIRMQIGRNERGR